MSDLPSFPYALLWIERPIRSAANDALAALRSGELVGTAVLA
jgi:hypothetical protein